MIADNGFVCLWRNMLYDPVWYNSTPEQKVLLITLLLMVCWKEQEYDVYGEKLTLKPGQIVTSVAEIKKLTGKHVSTKNIRTGIDRFQKMNFLAKETTKRGTLITIVNWRKYQDRNFESGKESGNELASDWQRTGNELAMNWQRGGKPIKEQRQQREQSNKVTKKQYINTPLPPLGERREGSKTSSVDEWEELIVSFAGKNESLSGSLRTWVNMRKEMSKKRKEVFTTQALKMGLKKLHNLSNGDETVALNIVNQSVELSWKSFYPINDSRRGKQEKTVEESLARSMKVLSEGMGDIPF